MAFEWVRDEVIKIGWAVRMNMIVQYLRLAMCCTYVSFAAIANVRG